MKSVLPEFYTPSKAQYKALLNEGTIVLDTNVLLDLYRLPPASRDRLLEVLEKHQENLWLPYHVALEFQKRRFHVLVKARENVDAAIEAVKLLPNTVEKLFDQTKFEQHTSKTDRDALQEAFTKACDQFTTQLKAIRDGQTALSSDDQIRGRLDAIFEGRVGPAPSAQKQIDDLLSDAHTRYESRRPPGFADIDKEKNPKEATYSHDGIVYERKFGDLIMWKQILSHAKAAKIKCLLLVTSDAKEDWWWIEHSQKLGPHPSLVAEMFREGGVETFWMYRLDQFLQRAGDKVPQTEIEEIQNLERAEELASWRNAVMGKDGRRAEHELAIHIWIETTFNTRVHIRDRSPRAAVEAPFGMIGFDITHPLSADRINEIAKTRLDQTRWIISSGGFQRYYLIFNITVLRISIPDVVAKAQNAFLSSGFSSNVGFIVGAVISGEFKVFYRSDEGGVFS